MLGLHMFKVTVKYLNSKEGSRRWGTVRPSPEESRRMRSFLNQKSWIDGFRQS